MRPSITPAAAAPPAQSLTARPALLGRPGGHLVERAQRAGLGREGEQRVQRRLADVGHGVAGRARRRRHQRRMRLGHGRPGAAGRARLRGAARPLARAAARARAEACPLGLGRACSSRMVHSLTLGFLCSSAATKSSETSASATQCLRTGGAALRRAAPDARRARRSGARGRAGARA